MDLREHLKDKKRIVIKIGSSSLTHPETGALNLTKMEVLIREITDLRNQGKDVVLVSSGAIAVGSQAAGFPKRPERTEEKQACAAIGQARLNAYHTFEELLKLGVVPIVNENDTVSTYEMKFGDNDRLSAIVTALVGADLLILLSDIDGLFTDDPHTNPEAEFIDEVHELDEDLLKMGKDTSSSNVGTGGMASKLTAARLAVSSGADMIIANGKDFRILHRLMNGEHLGTLFAGASGKDFYLMDYLEKL